MKIRVVFNLVLMFIFMLQVANAQSKLRPTFAGVYQSGLVGQVGIGTDNEKKYFGEIRFGANDVLETGFGIEGHFNRNIYKSDWFNFHAGAMFGYVFYSSARIGLPIGFTIKPIESHRNFAILMEATPNVFTSDSYVNLRASLGVRYTFR